MGLFVILRHLITPILNVSAIQRKPTDADWRSEGVKRVPQHLRSDVFEDDRYWRND